MWRPVQKPSPPCGSATAHHQTVRRNKPRRPAARLFLMLESAGASLLAKESATHQTHTSPPAIGIVSARDRRTAPPTNRSSAPQTPGHEQCAGHFAAATHAP